MSLRHDLNQRLGAYEPIDCGFHDELLSWATLRRPVEIAHRNDLGEETVIQGRIADVYTKNGAEFVKLENGDIIRLDMLVRVEEI